MCRPQFAGYGTWNVPTTFQSKCHWASAMPLTQASNTNGGEPEFVEGTVDDVMLPNAVKDSCNQRS